MNETLFYGLGIAVAVLAVAVSFIGIKSKDFPGRAAVPLALLFAVLVVGTATFGVRLSSEHQEEHATELEHAGEEIEAAEEGGATGGGEDAGEQGGSGGEPAGGGATVKIAADPNALAYDTTTLEAAAGEATFEFDNPSAIPHDFVIEKDGEKVAGTEVISEAEESFTAELEPGEYTFLCTVPGHAQAGMEGTLTVK